MVKQSALTFKQNTTQPSFHLTIMTFLSNLEHVKTVQKYFGFNIKANLDSREASYKHTLHVEEYQLDALR